MRASYAILLRYDITVEYLPHCCQQFAAHLDAVLYAAVIGRRVEVLSGSARQRADVASFVKALSLAALLNAPGTLE